MNGANPLNGINTPQGGANPLNQMAQKVQQEGKRAMSKEAEAAKKRLMEMRKGKNAPDMEQSQAKAESKTPPSPKPHRPSMNDVIPSKYKRWRKPGQENNNNNVSI
jgi:hypothetical protein